MAIITQSRNLSDYVATSTTAISTAPANKTLTVTAGKAFYVGQLVTFAAQAAKIATRLRGSVTAYNSATGVMDIALPANNWTEPDILITTALLLGTGSKTMSAPVGLNIAVGDPVRIQRIANQGNWMTGPVTAYDAVTGSLTVNVTANSGSAATYTDWTLCSEGTFTNWLITYQQADTLEIRNGATLTVDSTPKARPGTIQCITSGKLRVENASTTVPLILDLHDMNHDLRFEAGGVLEYRGAPMPLGTGNGAAQSWDFKALFGGAIRHMTYVEVEEVAGSGRYMPWPIVDEDPKFNLNVGAGATAGGADPTAFSAGNTLAGRVLFWHETNRTLRCGNGTNGGVIPNGCAVRIPNIYVSNRLLTNQSSVHNLVMFGTPTSGGVTVEVSRESGLVVGTFAVAFNDTAATISTAINALLGAGSATIGSGPLPGTAVSITWAGAYANERLGLRIAASTLAGGTNPHAVVYENNAANLSLIDLNPLGTFDAEWVSFSHKFKCLAEVFKSFRGRSLGFGGDSVAWNNSNGSIDIDGLCNPRSPYAGQGRSQIGSVLGDAKTSRIVSIGKSVSADFFYITTPGLSYADRIYGYMYGVKTSANNRTVQFTTIPADLVITNVAGIGAPIQLQNATNVKMVGISYADTTLSSQQTGQGTSAIYTNNCVDCTFAGIVNAGAGAPRSYTISTEAASSGLKVFGCTVDGANNTAGILMQCSGLEIRNMTLANARGGPLLDMPTTYLANNLSVKKMFATFATAQGTVGLDACQGGVYDLVSSSPLGITETFAGVNDFVGGNYADTSLTPTTGFVGFGPFGAGTGLELGGAAYTDALGAFLLPNAGDSATITMPFAMHGITGFANSNPLLYADIPGAAANTHVLAAPGAPTGGTFTITVYSSTGTLIGTTAPIAFGANGTTIATSIHSIAGIGTGNVACSNSLAGGGVITFQAALAGQSFILTIDGSLLTGGTEPGVAYVAGRARLLTGTETFGANITAEFACRVPGTAWPAWQAITGANLAAAIPALTGYAPGGSGLEMRIRLTTAVAHPLTKINQVCLPTTINPDGWFVGDASITFTGVNSTDTVEIVRASDDAVLYTFTGAGTKEFAALANFGVSAYLVRKSSTGSVLQTTDANPFTITVDDNGSFNLIATAIKSSNGDPLSTFVVLNGTPLGWVSLASERIILAGPTDVVQVYAHAYGYQPKLVTITGNTPSDYVLSLIPETNVDTTQTQRDTIAAAFGNGLDGLGRFYLSVNTDLRQYTPAQVLHGLHWHILTQGALVGLAAITAGDLNGFALIRGGFAIRTAGFYGKVADSVTTVGNLGILVPLSIAVDPAAYAEMPTYTPVEKNSSGIVLQYAPWTQQEADVPTWVAKEASVQAVPAGTWAYADRTLNGALFR